MPVSFDVARGLNWLTLISESVYSVLSVVEKVSWDSEKSGPPEDMSVLLYDFHSHSSRRTESM